MMNLPYDLNKTGRVAAMLLLVYCVAELAFIWAQTRLFAFYDVIESGTLTQTELDAAAVSVDGASTVVAVFFIAALMGCFVSGGMWIYRAAANAQAVIPDDNRITPGWSVGWFFIPFANLVMPYRSIKQTWNGLRGIGDLSADIPGWILLWWLAWLLGNAISTASSRISMDAASIDDFRFVSTLDIVSSVVAIIAAILFRKLILDLTQASAEAEPRASEPAPPISDTNQ